MPGIRIFRLRLRRKRMSPPPRIACGRFHLDHLSTKVGQNHGGAGTCNETCHVHNLEPRKNVITCHRYLLNLRERRESSAPAEQGCTLCEERSSALSLVFGCGAEAEIRGL